MAICITLMMGRIGSVAGSNAVAVFFETMCNTTFLLSGGLLVVCAMLSILLPTADSPLKPKTTPVDVP